jgi:predicted metal-dependent phosphoesterase TrpH
VLDIQDIITQAKKLGLDGVCITDHQSMEIRQVISEGIQDNGICVLFGMEYSTAQGDFLIFGPFTEMAPNLSADQLLKSVSLMGGAAIAAHPFRKRRPVDERIIREGLCTAVETINGRNTSQENLAVNYWRQRFHLAECGGSDAHSLPELGAVATRFFKPVRTRRELIDAIKQHRCRSEIFASSMRLAQARRSPLDNHLRAIAV